MEQSAPEQTAAESMVVEADDRRIKYVPFEEATTPPAGLIECIKDSWWSVHPERGVMFWEGRFAQCHRDEATARTLHNRTYPWAEFRFIPAVFRRINPRDYR